MGFQVWGSISGQTGKAHTDMNMAFGEEPIDAVITWVDGGQPEHRSARAAYMAQTAAPLGENASNPHRWESSDEVYFCLHSIHTHAPWVRTIWLLVEQDAPDLSSLPQALCDKVRTVTHADIFAGYGDALPTFNSLAIESVMWRIEGLSERFLYFNDDVFLTAALTPEDMFHGVRPVLRGAWRDYSALVQDTSQRANPAAFNHFMQINAAALCGYTAERVFAAAHVVHPMQRSVMATAFEVHQAAFEANISHRFRDLSQFLPQGLHNHSCIAQDEVVFASHTAHRHLKSGQGSDTPSEVTRALLTKQGLAGVTFLCVNDLPQLEVLVPDARALIAQAVEGP